MPNIGPMELIIILIIALVVFGPKRLPDLGRSLGNGMREFKDSVAGKGHDEDDDAEASDWDDGTGQAERAGLPSPADGNEHVAEDQRSGGQPVPPRS